jgi:L-idonate 5-dehydrogenase
MHAVVIHSAKDLRIDPVTVGQPGPGQVRIKMARGGICGSDLHYYQDGRIGTIIVKQPLTLGHEVAGHIEALGAGVTGLKTGDLVAINPSRPCNSCKFCRQGQQVHCLDMRFYGSAMRFPHVHGAFQDALVTEAAQCFVMPASVTPGEAAMCEPMAVCLHAINRAGSVYGKRVLVTGCGPIGALCIAAARASGAAEIVATDVTDTPFAVARQMGADRCINVARDAAALQAFSADKGTFDVVLECSGNQQALVSAFDVLLPGGIIVQVGLGGAVTLPINTVVNREFELRGTFRFHGEFALAAQWIGARRIDVQPLITATFPMTDAIAAFELAGDRSKAMKVQLAFG